MLDDDDSVVEEAVPISPVRTKIDSPFQEKKMESLLKEKGKEADSNSKKKESLKVEAIEEAVSSAKDIRSNANLNESSKKVKKENNSWSWFSNKKGTKLEDDASSGSCSCDDYILNGEDDEPESEEVNAIIFTFQRKKGAPSVPPPTLKAINNPLKIGRYVGKPDEEDTLGLRSKIISRNHAEIWQDEFGKKTFVRDCGSHSGTFLNNNRLSPATVTSKAFELNEGDTLQFGVDYYDPVQPGDTGPPKLNASSFIAKIQFSKKTIIKPAEAI